MASLLRPTRRGVLFRSVFLGETFPTVDFLVILEGATVQGAHFFVQIKTTTQRYAGNRLPVPMSLRDIQRLRGYPAPVYIIGVDARRQQEQAYIVAVTQLKQGGLRSLPKNFSLNDDAVLLDLWDEVNVYGINYGAYFHGVCFLRAVTGGYVKTTTPDLIEERATSLAFIVLMRRDDVYVLDVARRGLALPYDLLVAVLGKDREMQGYFAAEAKGGFGKAQDSRIDAQAKRLRDVHRGYAPLCPFYFDMEGGDDGYYTRVLPSVSTNGRHETSNGTNQLSRWQLKPLTDESLAEIVSIAKQEARVGMHPAHTYTESVEYRLLDASLSAGVR